MILQMIGAINKCSIKRTRLGSIGMLVIFKITAQKKKLLILQVIIATNQCSVKTTELGMLVIFKLIQPNYMILQMITSTK